MNNIQVSIIIPSFNSGKYIVDSVKSALFQSYRNIEIIIVDDGSTDDSLSLLKEYENQIIIIKQKNKGGGAARNTGLFEAKGEFIKFLDADDILCNNSIEQQVKFLQDRDSNDEIVYGDFQYIDENGKKLSINSQPKFEPNNQIPTLIEKAIITSSPLYRRTDLLEINGFNEKLKGNQEHELNLRLALNLKKFIYKSGVIYFHRMHNSPSRISKRDWCKTNPDFAMNLLLHYQNLIEKSSVVQNQNINQALAHRHIGSARCLLRANKVDLAKKHFKIAQELVAGIYYRIGNNSRSFTKYYLGIAKIIGLRNTERSYFLLSEIKRKIIKPY